MLYSGPLDGLAEVAASETGRYVFAQPSEAAARRRSPAGWLTFEGISKNNVRELAVRFPLGVLTSVTGISGSGKSTLVGQAVVDLVADALGVPVADAEAGDTMPPAAVDAFAGSLVGGLGGLRRLIVVDQKAIGRTPRSNLATYTGLFDHVRRLFAKTPAARARRYDAGRFSFNVAKGRCPNCNGEGFVMVELLFLPSVYKPCPVCGGSRFNAKTLEIRYQGRHIAEVLGLTVEEALAFFQDEEPICRSLSVLEEVGLGYLRLGQPATELSGGEAQRIKLATELQRVGKAESLYILDEPTTGLHPADVDRLIAQLQRLVDAGNTVIVVEHDMRLVAASDWAIDLGPGAGDQGGRVVFEGHPDAMSRVAASRTGVYLARQRAH